MHLYEFSSKAHIVLHTSAIQYNYDEKPAIKHLVFRFSIFLGVSP